MLAGLWEELRAEWERDRSADLRPPVFIIVCKNTRIADVIYKWLGENDPPSEIPPAKIAGFVNADDRKNTICVTGRACSPDTAGRAGPSARAFCARRDCASVPRWREQAVLAMACQP